MIDFEIRELAGSDAMSVVTPLYTKEGSGIVIHHSDLFFVGFFGEELVGSVRFCVEQETPMLRTMRIAKSYQGKGFGHRLLKNFEAYLIRNKIQETYCLPYSHLEHFYGSIGFKSIEEQFAPIFLQDRLREYRNKQLGTFLCMSRRAGTP